MVDIKFNSSIILLIQIDWCVAHDVEIYSAFEDDKVVVSCFFEVQATALDPKFQNIHQCSFYRHMI